MVDRTSLNFVDNNHKRSSRFSDKTYILKRTSCKRFYLLIADHLEKDQYLPCSI